MFTEHGPDERKHKIKLSKIPSIKNKHLATAVEELIMTKNTIRFTSFFKIVFIRTHGHVTTTVKKKKTLKGVNLGIHLGEPLG